MNDYTKQLISLETIKVLKLRFDSFPSEEIKTRNAPFHKAFLNAFSDKLSEMGTDVDAIISMSSWMHGLNTTLGQSFFENVSHILCGGGKQTFKNNSIYQSQASIISEIMTDLKNGVETPNVERELNLIAQNANGDWQTVPDFTADCFYEDEENVVAIELKSVRPNSGEMRGEKQKILLSKTALAHKYPNKKISYLFGFPFDPLASSDVGYDKCAFMDSIIEFTKFCAKEEILLSDELWSFLSGEEGTMLEVLTIIRSIATPRFFEEFYFLSNTNNIALHKEAYLDILRRWNLFDEMIIASHYEELLSSTNKKVQRAVRSSPFSEKGEYQKNRLECLKAEL